jgi:A/G-specific adenine glycosylase
MPVDASAALLCWYAVDKRSLPWRAEPGDTPDPYAVWLSEIMLQQTTVAAVKPYFHTFLSRWPTVEALAAADDAEVMTAWAGLGYYARARNLLACARAVVADHGGRFPEDEAALRRLPGIGAYTSAAIAAIAFGKDAAPVDGNIERVVSRLFAVADPLPAARPRIAEAMRELVPTGRAGDFAQAMMDLGATICTPRAPRCSACPVASWCRARAEGDPERFPVKAKKAAKPERTGRAYWLEQGGAVLLVRRPSKGLLGGMLALPEEAPVAGAWAPAGSVRHVFTHFALTAELHCAELPHRTNIDLPDATWWPVDALDKAGLPTLFARLAARGRAWGEAA